jgi:aspartate/methionine/tyrosine aminotransferase
MFSARTRWDLTPNRLARILEAKRTAGEPVIDLTESNPTRAGIPYPSGLLTPLADPAALRYEPTPWGLEPAREAVAADFARRGFPLRPDRILLTASTSEAYSLLFKLLCDPGDEVLVPRPGYPLFDYLAGLESVRVVSYPLEYDGAWRLDMAALAAAVTSRSRAVVTVNPNNPTGSYLKRDEARALRALCAERGLALISDEVFADYARGEDASRMGSVAEDGGGLAFALGGLSKSCGLPQLKMAWIATSGPEGVRNEALSRLEVVADAFLSVGTPVQVAAPSLLARRVELQAPIRARLRENGEMLRARLASSSPARLLEPEGGWYGVLRVPATHPEEIQVARLLEQSNVLVHPGYFFDFPTEAYIVLSLLPPPPLFALGLGRILDSLML